MDTDFPGGKANWHYGRVEIHCCTYPVGTDAYRWIGHPTPDIRGQSTCYKSLDQAVHVMRDYFSHTELLLAGLIGGCGGIYHGVADHMRNFARSWKNPHPRFLDQHFLRDYVWPTARESLATHDSLFGFHGGRPFPPHPDHGYGAKFHVGSNFASDEICVSSGTPTARAVAWRLFDTNGTLICAYDASVFDGEWRAALPKTYIDRLRAGDWRLEAVAK
jgi:hypothetical protein